MVYNAVFITHLLLSAFRRIGEEERLAVELVLDLSVSYNLDYGRIAMSRDVYGKARVFLPQLLKLAERHGYTTVSKDSDFGYIEAHALLLAIVQPLVAHLCPYEHKEVQNSLPEAYQLLDLPLPKLRPAVEAWSSKNFEMTLQTAPLPRANYDQLKHDQTRSLPRIKTRSVKRRALNMGEPGPSMIDVRLNPRVECIGFDSVDSPSFGEPCQPWWVDRPTGGRALGVGLCTMSVEEFGSPVFSEYSSSKGSSSGPATPATTNPEYWNDRMGYGKLGHGISHWDSRESSDGKGAADTREIPRTVGQKLKRGLRAMFSTSTGSNAI
ncbi:hypothetical protein FRC06_007821 [Ceratobasidium sp. 370]|nr:hypothetical protein FRC06_007821 [Ceratobasidium sp. 370]